MALIGCLDTRFYFAHAEGKSAWTRRIVDEALQPGSLVISSTVTITELLSVMGAEVGLETVRLRINSAKAVGVGFIPPSEEIASRAGEIALKDRELPLADAIIAATAMDQTGGRVYTDDPHFKKIPGIRIVWGGRL